MRTSQVLTTMVVLALLASCASVAKFPVSDETPAADITAKSRKQGAQNYLVIITANHLAASERLASPKKKLCNLGCF